MEGKTVLANKTANTFSSGKNCPSLCLPTAVCKAAALRDVQLRYNLLHAKQVGVGEVHLHQTRHSYARIIAEESGSITDTQDALGHRNAATTRMYVQRIAVKKDKYSDRITMRIEKKNS